MVRLWGPGLGGTLGEGGAGGRSWQKHSPQPLSRTSRYFLVGGGGRKCNGGKEPREGTAKERVGHDPPLV